jgi:hypothetical protein
MEYPTLPQDIQTINQQLIDHFGVDTITGKAMWRVSWAGDQTEKRLTKYTDQGVELLFPEVLEKVKYPWIKGRWILERLVLVPIINQDEIPADPQSYECMWIFESPITNEAIPPIFTACKFVVDTVYAAIGKSSMAKYVDEEAANPIEAKEKRINQLVDELYGEESSLLLRTKTGEAVAYTGPTPFGPNESKEPN